jgi:thymidylate synthase ThyX
MAENKVTLIGYYGGDKTHCLSAWQSTGIDFSYTKNINSRIDLLFDKTVKSKKKTPQELLTMLANDGHHTPFEKSTLHFQLRTDLATKIQFLKHRIGVSINCLAGSNTIQFWNSNGESLSKLNWTLDELFCRWNKGRSHQNTQKDMLYQRERIRGMNLESYNEDTGEFFANHIVDVIYRGENPTYRYLIEGDDIVCTENHRVLTESGWMTIEEAYVQNIRVAVKRHTSDLSVYKQRRSPEIDVNSEVWKPTDVEGYEVSNQGRIRSYYRNRYLRKDLPPVIKEQVDNKQGRLVVSLKGKAHLVSRLVALAFVENPDSKPQVRHLNSVTYDNRACNLAWGTDEENKKDYACSSVHAGSPKNRAVFAPIKDKEFVSIQRTYDLEVESPYHNFTCNGLIVHNSESARYKELEDKWYIPKDWEGIDVLYPGVNCQEEGVALWEEAEHYLFDNECFSWAEALDHYARMGHQLYHLAVKQLTPVLGRKRAKESARYFLPYSKQLDFDVQFNFRSFVHFQGLRNSKHAQLEIRLVAKEMLSQVKAIPGNPFQYSLEAFGL